MVRHLALVAADDQHKGIKVVHVDVGAVVDEGKTGVGFLLQHAGWLHAADPVRPGMCCKVLGYKMKLPPEQ